MSTARGVFKASGKDWQVVIAFGAVFFAEGAF
jgi:hypothetical protein